MDFQGTGLQSGHLIVRSTVKAAEARIHVLDVGSGSKKWGGFNTPKVWQNGEMMIEHEMMPYPISRQTHLFLEKNAENQQL